MLRRNLVVWTLACVTLGAFEARAGISYDFVFRSTGTNEIEFASVAAAQSATVIGDIVMSTTDYLIYNGISIGWDDTLGLDVGTVAEWRGTEIPGSFYVSDLGGPVSCDGSVTGVPPPPSFPYCTLFNGAAPVPNAPPSLSPGTYNIGTIIWDTSGIQQGATPISPFLLVGVDATGAVRPPAGNIVDITGTEVLTPSLITVIPEPGTAALLGLGLAAVVLAGRRRR